MEISFTIWKWRGESVKYRRLPSQTLLVVEIYDPPAGTQRATFLGFSRPLAKRLLAIKICTSKLEQED